MVECFWGPAIPTVVDCDELDLNGDGFVDLSDVKLFLESL